jgi:enamine deaminase RidA (YjgF/YER057c/UK114 family)
MDNQLLCFARLAATVARRVVPLQLSKFAQPTYPPASLLAVLLLKEHLRLTYRSVEDLLRLSGPLRRVLALPLVPDHSTLWWFARRHLTPALLARALRETVRRAATDRTPPRQVALDSTGQLVGPGDFRAQAEQVYRNLQRALASVNGSLDDVVKTTTFITDSKNLAALREVRTKYLDSKRAPANTLLIVAGLARPELLLEIEAVAVLGQAVRLTR